MASPIRILAIESSCDDTSAAIIEDRHIVANLIANQEIHSKYGGVVPELASREHQKNIVPVVNSALTAAQMSLEDLDAIAYTRGPGLLGSLLVGSNFAKGLSISLGIPLIEVNHMHGHILAHFIENNQYNKSPAFPFLCLTVSGGHTQIVLVEDHLKMQVIGETLDDAAGEAFDKIAKLLGLEYPGGPQIDELAQSGNHHAYKFPKSKVGKHAYSFSGLKTAVLYFLKNEIELNPNFIEENRNDLCASVQFTIVDTLMDKFVAVANELKVKDIAIAGGVSANSYLRERLTQLEKSGAFNVFIPKFEYCTDNAAMIAIVAHFKYLNKEFSDLSVVPKARMYL